MISIREATTADVPLLADLSHAIQELHRAGDPDRYRAWNRAGAARTFAHAFADGAMIWLATWAGQPAGFAMATVRDREASPLRHASRELRLDQIAVLPRRQRRGVGRALLEVITEEARRRECVCLDLQVAAFNEPAVAFYESLGYRTTFLTMQLDLDVD